MKRIALKRSHATPVAAGHPWVFAQAVAEVRGDPQGGEEVIVIDPQGVELGRGFWSPASAIAVRLLTRDPARPLDEAFFRERLRDAVALRRQLALPCAQTTGYRLVNAEGDGLPGLIVDAYEDTLVMQVLTEGVAQRQQQIARALEALLSPRAILASWGGDALRSEGQPRSAGPPHILYGEPPASLRFAERGFRFQIELGHGQKTGFYFDQREHRAEVERLAAGKRVLDACCYVGGFALAAARGGAAAVLAMDSSRGALDIARTCAERNQLPTITFQRADVRQELARLAHAGTRFELVVLDPPKLVPTVKHLEKGRRLYRRLNAHALRLVEPGGLLVTCSCSAAMGETDFLRMLALAARDAKRELAILRVGKQGPDHPLAPGFSEGSYLKTVFALVR